ncbi:MAG: glycosyltransferase, partial [Brevinematales bacterium]|nr:glycosyltransferase [Brevinematales bacterium]
MDKGGGVTQALEAVNALRNFGHDIKQFDWFSEEIDFDIFFLFGFTHFNPEVLLHLREKGKKIIVEPIFVRMSSIGLSKLSQIMRYFPISNTIKTQYQVLTLSDLVFTNSDVEREEISFIYGIDKSKIFVAYLGLPSYVKDLENKVSKDLFYNTYGVKDFVFYPSARISVRKNQISLIRALKGSGIKLVLTGCNDIDKEIEGEFRELVKGDKDILCLPVLDKEMLISAYK